MKAYGRSEAGQHSIQLRIGPPPGTYSHHLQRHAPRLCLYGHGQQQCARAGLAGFFKGFTGLFARDVAEGAETVVYLADSPRGRRRQRQVFHR